MMTALVVGVWVIVVLLGTIVGYMQHFTFELEQMRQRLPTVAQDNTRPPYLRGNYTVEPRE